MKIMKISFDYTFLLFEYVERQDSTKMKTNSILRPEFRDISGLGPSSPGLSDVESESVVVAESFEKLIENKHVKKQRDKLNKKLEDIQKEFEKEKTKLEEELGIVTKSKVTKTSSRLIKRISSKNL